MSNLPFIDDRGNLDLEAFQADVTRWADRNFGEVEPRLPFLGMVEEMGELAHALLKFEQRIRGHVSGNEENLQADLMDAVGDWLVFAANFASKCGFSLEEAVTICWSQVRMRNWRAYPETGFPPADILDQVDYYSGDPGDEDAD